MLGICQLRRCLVVVLVTCKVDSSDDTSSICIYIDISTMHPHPRVDTTCSHASTCRHRCMAPHIDIWVHTNTSLHAFMQRHYNRQHSSHTHTEISEYNVTTSTLHSKFVHIYKNRMHVFICIHDIVLYSLIFNTLRIIPMPVILSTPGVFIMRNRTISCVHVPTN
jgi:hypothetical protein